MPMPSPLTTCYDTLKTAINDDNDYAWSWHCNIAMPLQDMGIEWTTSNAIAARIMSCLFSTNITHYWGLAKDQLESVLTENRFLEFEINEQINKIHQQPQAEETDQPGTIQQPEPLINNPIKVMFENIELNKQQIPLQVVENMLKWIFASQVRHLAIEDMQAMEAICRFLCVLLKGYVTSPGEYTGSYFEITPEIVDSGKLGDSRHEPTIMVSIEAVCNAFESVVKALKSKGHPTRLLQFVSDSSQKPLALNNEVASNFIGFIMAQLVGIPALEWIDEHYTASTFCITKYVENLNEIIQNQVTTEAATEKPPIGLRPRHLYTEQVRIDRLREIDAAVGRYLKSGAEVPKDWISEARQLLQQLPYGNKTGLNLPNLGKCPDTWTINGGAGVTNA